MVGRRVECGSRLPLRVSVLFIQYLVIIASLCLLPSGSDAVIVEEIPL